MSLFQLQATTPPPAEWNVPHDGQVDKTFTVTAAPELNEEEEEEEDEEEASDEEEVSKPKAKEDRL